VVVENVQQYMFKMRSQMHGRAEQTRCTLQNLLQKLDEQYCASNMRKY
jgi:hypothetical protein